MQARTRPLRRLWIAGLIGGLTVAALPVARPGDVKEELARIEKDLRQEFKDLREAAVATDDEDAAREMFAEYYSQILPVYLERMAVVARESQGEDAVTAWLRVVQHAGSGEVPSKVAAEALTALTTKHIESESLADMCMPLRYGTPGLGLDNAVAALETLGETSPHAFVRANALIALGSVLGEEADDDDPRLARARAAFQKVIAAYADEKSLDGRTCGESARASLFAMDNLRVGKPCPDFGAVDAEGAAFKLSDYRGKVVLVDFWGFW